MISVMLQKISRATNLIVWVLEALSTLAMMIIVFSFGWLVFGRYVLNETPTWVEHGTILLITLITFSMMAVNERHGANLAVGVLTDRLPEKSRSAFLAVVDCLVAVFGVVCAVYGVRLGLFNAGITIPLLGISEGIRMIPLAIGGAILALVSLLNAAERFYEPSDPIYNPQDGAATLDSSKLDLKDS